MIKQFKNPRTGKYVLVDTKSGKIVGSKKSDGAYKRVPYSGQKKRKF